jgi:hypothetical protein
MASAASVHAPVLLDERVVGARARARGGILVFLGTVVAAGAAIRFSTLGLQSYQHDEVITAMRVLDGSFGHMLHEVKVSESNPPLYYVLAWGWTRAFGSGEVELRFLSALFGVLAVGVGYLLGRDLASRRVGLALAALMAFNPMLIWYSQEARSYSLLVLLCTLSLWFFVRSLKWGRGSDLAWWALASALALCSHYFAFFAVGIEAIWLAVALRSRWWVLGPALAAVAITGLALLPLLIAQTNSVHTGWITNTPLPARMLQTGTSFLIGETGSVLGQPTSYGYAVAPAFLVAFATLLVALRGSAGERRAAAIGAVVGLGVLALAAAAALVGKDYVLERNLLPALVPLVLIVALAFAGRRTGLAGVAIGVALCAYWLAFDVYVTQRPSLQRPEFRSVARVLGSPQGRRAIVSLRLSPPPLKWYLEDGAERMYRGSARLDEVDILARPKARSMSVALPAPLHPAGQLTLPQFVLRRYVSPTPVLVPFTTLQALPTGFDGSGITLDGEAPTAHIFRREHPHLRLSRGFSAHDLRRDEPRVRDAPQLRALA